ncbi:hypothetical protein Q8A73_020043 [Channa argus]|nr:hypothetical protein Q8A73_020043 [Channa argus]
MDIWFLEDRKRTFADVTKTSRLVPECFSPERKRRRLVTERPSNRIPKIIVMKNLERPHTSRKRPCYIKKRQKRPKRKQAKIWIIGSNYIQRGEEAAKKIFGVNLGLNAKVEWFGQGGMRWSRVLPWLYHELCRQSPPDILVIHAGGNDLGRMSAKHLVLRMQQDLREFHEKFPATKLLYSCINERKVWRGGRPAIIDNGRKMVNAKMRKALGSLGGQVIEHPNLRFFDRSIYQPDGVHFTKKGNAIFLSSIRGSLQTILNSALLSCNVFIAPPDVLRLFFCLLT